MEIPRRTYECVLRLYDATDKIIKEERKVFNHQRNSMRSAAQVKWIYNSATAAFVRGEMLQSVNGKPLGDVCTWKFRINYETGKLEFEEQ